MAFKLRPVKSMKPDNNSRKTYPRTIQKCSFYFLLWSMHPFQDISQLAFYVNLHRAVIGPSATLTGRWRPDVDLRRMLTGLNVYMRVVDEAYLAKAITLHSIVLTVVSVIFASKGHSYLNLSKYKWKVNSYMYSQRLTNGVSQSTVSMCGSIISGCRLENCHERGLKTVSFKQ